ncbi:MAG: restriction endonuclease subunit S [Psychrobacter sp.]|uniref:restriction endonuclease subunit S n=1 Tax=Psychrobacter sp. AOP7-B1-24 TaxID=3457645 RepID=UPI003FB68F43
MAKYQRYEEYKESDVEWLGQVPTHWGTKSLKYLCTYNDEVLSDSTSKEFELEYVDIGSVSSTEGITNTENMVFEKAPSRAKRVVQDGDVIISTVRTYLEAIAPINNPPQNMIVSTGFAVIRPNECLYKGYAAYCLRAKGFIKEVVSLSVGVSYPAINATDLVSIKIPSLPFDEQTQIANFLDFETAQIDTLIEKQQTLIQLLKEKRQAVISHAVTKGLNPDAPMKDSGVEWLGSVPEHWDIVKLKWKASTTSGGTPTTSKYEDYYEDGDIPWIRTTDLNNDKLNETPIMITPKAVRDSACSLLPKNSVLIAMYGGAGSIGKHSLLRFESTINQAVCGVLPSEAFVPDYLHRFYEFYRPFWMIGAAGTRKDPNIGQDNIKEARIPIPPLNEQHQIADYLDKMQNHFDALTENAEQAIQLMQERRTALISAAVTGKIDVRGWRVADD